MVCLINSFPGQTKHFRQIAYPLCPSHGNGTTAHYLFFYDLAIRAAQVCFAFRHHQFGFVYPGFIHIYRIVILAVFTVPVINFQHSRRCHKL
jgi:hypothetical protein